jgi:hypothetical protein
MADDGDTKLPEAMVHREPHTPMVPSDRGAVWIGDLASRGSNSSPMDQPMPVPPRGEQ